MSAKSASSVILKRSCYRGLIKRQSAECKRREILAINVIDAMLAVEWVG